MSEGERRQLLAQIGSLAAEVRRLVETNAEIVAALKRTERRLDRSEKENERLRRELAQSRGTLVNGPNTPSGQQPVFTKPDKPNGKKKPGRKRGHEAANRAAAGEPTATVEHELEQCPSCGGKVTPLKEKSGRVRLRVRYIEDIEPSSPSVTEHRIPLCWCKKCNRRVEPAILAAMPGDRIGLRVIVTTAIQHYHLGISISKIREMLRVQHNFRVSAGGLTLAWKRLAAHLQFEYEAILEKVRNSGVLHKDETGWRVNGKRSWLWCFGTKTDAYYVIDRSRGGNVVNDVLGEFFEGVSVRDFYVAYGACDMRETQYCLAHVLRDAKYIAEKYASVMTNKVREFCDGLTRLLRRAISFAANPKIGPPMRERAYDRYVKRIYAITDGRFLNEDVERLAARLSTNAHSLFTFVKRPGVDPTNNFAEGLLRPAVIMRKSSFGNRSENGAQTQGVLMSCFRSMKLRGHDLYEETTRLVHARILDDHAAKGHDRASDR